MEENYTETMKDSVYENGFLGEDYDEDQVIRFISNPGSFRSFSDGLKTLFNKIGLSGNAADRISFIMNRLQSIHVTIDRKTVASWVNGTKRPKIEPKSRPKMFRLCFALQLSLADTIWFFHHVYYDIPFNYRRIDEAVYYYAIKNGIDYQTAEEIIDRVSASPCIDAANDNGIDNYTQFMRTKLDQMDSTQELVDYLSQNKPNFSVWNQTAYRHLKSMVDEMIGSESLRPSIEQYRNKLERKFRPSSCAPSDVKRVRTSDYFDCNAKECGLILREILFDAEQDVSCPDPDRFVLDQIKNKDLFSHDFLLQYIIGSTSGLPGQADLPDVIKTNFPSKIVMSELLGRIHRKDSSVAPGRKIDRLETYDKIRKLLILLSFYTFWVTVKLEKKLVFSDADVYYESYIDDTNELLRQCGYEDLFFGNPYDWIFLHCSNSVIGGEYPVFYFREFITDLSETGE